MYNYYILRRNMCLNHHIEELKGTKKDNAKLNMHLRICTWLRPVSTSLITIQISNESNLTNGASELLLPAFFTRLTSISMY